MMVGDGVWSLHFFESEHRASDPRLPRTVDFRQ
jgi:hypothetical protein